MPKSAWARGIVAGAMDIIASRAVVMIAILIVFMAEREAGWVVRVKRNVSSRYEP